MKWQYHLPALLAGLLFTGCAGKGGNTAEAGGNPFTVPAGALAANAAEFGTPIKRGENQTAQAEAAARAAGYDSNTDLSWTQADNPDAELPELQELMAQGPQEDSWRKSESESLRESRRTGKPLLIWFTDSLNSSASKTLSEQLLTTSEFQEWASENTIRLVVDQNQGSNIDEAVRKRIHARELKKKYNARGYPTLMVVAPSGEVIGRYTGYRRGKEDFIFGQVKQGVSVAAENQKVWRSSLEKKGYREWSGAKGRTIFAKLGAYKDGELVLVEPDGTRARTNEKRLSAEDRVWIQQQKEARGIQ